MKKMIIFFILLFAFGMAGNAGAATADGKNFNRFDAKAVWNPDMNRVQSILHTCSQKHDTDFGRCFVEQMKKSGAEPEATAFAIATGNQGYMRDFKNCGRVDIAFTVYPFRANENQLCFLVNGSPPMIDIDDSRYLPLAALKQNKTYQKIQKRYPEVALWPGDRSGTGFPIVYDSDDGGQQFIFNYRLQDGCHACRCIGFATIAFDFDPLGKLIKTRVVSVIDTQQLKSNGTDLNVYSTDKKTIHTSAGKTFMIVLDSNPTTGYAWELANPIDKDLIKWIGKEYLPAKSRIPGAGGREVWSFIAEGSGRADIVFHYLRPWETQQSPAKVRTFHVRIK